MGAYVGVTDLDWFQQLRTMSLAGGLEEVNFWIPSGRAFSLLQPGDPFLFKLHKAAAGGVHVVAGGGVFVRSVTLPVSLAWECFQFANGVASLDEMRRRIARYRRQSADVVPEPRITCVILAEPFFFDDTEWIAVPSWKDNIVSGRRLLDDDATDQALLAEAMSRSAAKRALAEPPARYREAVGKVRLGQGSFKALVRDTYRFRCAVTGAKALPTLEAAHIMPYSEGGEHQIVNGLLLRSDVHTLFDKGYVTITPDYRFRASPRLRDEFQNGAEYYELAGRPIELPEDPRQHPDRDLLTWHGERHGFGA